jgi:WD40 repeat protein
MSTKKKLQKFLSLVVLLVISSVTLSAQENLKPRFGSGIIILERPGIQIMWEPNLSPSGDFVFTNSAAFEVRDANDRVWLDNASFGGIQVLWDIQEVNPDGIPIYIDPIREEALVEWEYVQGSIITEYGPIRAFSPDGHYMAIKTYSDVSIFTIPELELYRTLPITIVAPKELYLGDSLKWSLDGQLLATFADNEIIVWDFENDVVESYTFGNNYEVIASFEDGWFGKNRYLEDMNGFFACDLWLLDCYEYELTSRSHPIITPDGEVVFYEHGTTERIIDFWYRQADGQYHLSNTLNQHHSWSLDINFSPDGLYMVLWHDGTIQEFPAFDLVSTMRAYQKTAWLPDSHHLVTLYPYDYELTMGLYEVGNDEPIDTLDLVEIFGEEKIIDEWYEHNIITEQTMDVSGDGKWVLVNLGWAVLVIPIVYE